MQYPIKYIENNLVWNHDGECFAYYELIPYNYSFLSVEQKEAVHDAFRQLIAQNRDGKIHALQISTESSIRAAQERSKAYEYDNESRVLSVPLDAIASGQTKTVCFDVLVNSDAYGMTIENTAVASGSNAPDTEDTDDGVTIEDGTPDGRAGAKSANKTTARVGDTITYTITLENGALATADWIGATVTDVLPDDVTFAGNVQKDGQATTEYSYEAASRTLSLSPSAIQPGEQASYTFDVTVDEGMQGELIINTAILTDDDKQTPLPDAGVQIDEGEADPIVTKSANVFEANVGDTVSYTITVKNGDKATAPWRNVVAYDTLPAGVKLIGNVYLDGKTALHKLSGNGLSVMVGDLAAGESMTGTFDVQVLDEAARYNSAKQRHRVRR